MCGLMGYFVFFSGQSKKKPSKKQTAAEPAPPTTGMYSECAPVVKYLHVQYVHN